MCGVDRLVFARGVSSSVELLAESSELHFFDFLARIFVVANVSSSSVEALLEQSAFFMCSRAGAQCAVSMEAIGYLVRCWLWVLVWFSLRLHLQTKLEAWCGACGLLGGVVGSECCDVAAV